MKFLHPGSISISLAFLFIGNPCTESRAAVVKTPGEALLLQAFPQEVHGTSLIRLWPEQAPDEIRPFGEESVVDGPRHGGSRIQVVTQPSVLVVPPKGSNMVRPAVLVCPGGGYGSLGLDSGGTDVIRWLHGLGITGIYVKYRVPKRNQGFPMHHHPLQDVQRAMCLLRAKSHDLQIDPKRIGIIGFSAGGHLASMLATHHHAGERAYAAIDDADKQSFRPDFVMLVAPAYLTYPILSQDLAPEINLDGMARNITPPFFITSASTDKFTVGAAQFALALREKRIPVEVHFYEQGGHAEGVTDRDQNAWFLMAADWMRRKGFLHGGHD